MINLQIYNFKFCVIFNYLNLCLIHEKKAKIKEHINLLRKSELKAQE